MKKNLKNEIIAYIFGELFLIGLIVELALVLLYKVH